MHNVAQKRLFFTFFTYINMLEDEVRESHKVLKAVTC